MVSCGGCASKQPLVRTETITVDRPVIVAVPAELTRGVSEPKLSTGVVTNDDLADFIDVWRAALGLANCQLEKIANLGPGEDRNVECKAVRK